MGDARDAGIDGGRDASEGSAGRGGSGGAGGQRPEMDGGMPTGVCDDDDDAGSCDEDAGALR